MWQPIIPFSLLLWIALILGFSLTCAGFLVLFRLSQTREYPAIDYLKYYFIFLSIYVWYGLWCQFLLPLFVTLEQAEHLIVLVTLLGIPFYFVSLAMLLVWTCSLNGKKPEVYVPVVVLVAFGLALLVLRVHGSAQGMAVASLVFYVAVSVLLVIRSRQVKTRKAHFAMLACLVTAGVLQTGYSYLRGTNWLVDLGYVLLFLLCHTAFVVLYLYNADYTQSNLSFEGLLSKHGISQREADVIQGIYEGKTNQEIADKLFISLQTVKDHTSRIYQKTHVKNRTQLAAMLRDSVSDHAGK